MPDLVPIRRALLSVSDKTGLAAFATALVNEFYVELISTGGTAKFLRDLNLPVKDVSDVTGFPEMMDGRVKTLHPKIHGGLLALRDHSDHIASMQQHDIAPIDLVVINLYPFAKTIEKPGVSFEEAIENIDIGGPSMIRSAAKNHGWVLVVTSPGRYEKVLGDLREHGGRSCAKHRLKQSQSAFAHTAEYDGLIAKYLAKHITPEVEKDVMSAAPVANAERSQPLRTTPARTTGADETPKLPLIQRLIGSAHDLPAFMKELITHQAVLVKGTEAAAFTVEPPRADRVAEIQAKYLPLAHIRPDDSGVETRVAALTAFYNLIEPCVVQGKDGAIEVGPPLAGANEPQFCLITLLRNATGVAAVSAVVIRCSNLDEAKQRLKFMQSAAGYFELYCRATQPGPVTSDETGNLPETLRLALNKQQSLRYGENPHQSGALYVDKQPAEASVAYAAQLHGKELSYINLLDADGALSAVKEFSIPAACIVKHTTPCGCATASTIAEAFTRAFAGDPLAAFGGIVAMNRAVDLSAAQAITSIDKLLEVIVAPSFDDDALALLKDRWKNVRLLAVGPVDTVDPGEFHLHRIVGGYLVQQRDLTGDDDSNWRVASQRQPTAAEMLDLKFAWKVCKHVKSNAIVIAKNQMLLGAGAGQMDRPSAARLAIAKAGDRGRGAVAASDAFFPFPDGPELLLDAGVTAIIHPGGSLKDQLTIDLANTRGAAVVLTGERHFKH